MRCEEVAINLAENMLLTTDIVLDNKTYHKGYALTKEDLIIFKMHGIERLSGIFTDENDLHYHTVLGIVAAKLCGSNTAYAIDKNGICQIVAMTTGIFNGHEERLSKFNRLDDNIVLNSIEPYSFVQKGDVIACLESIPPAMSQTSVDDILFKLSGNIELLSVTPLTPKKAALIYAKSNNSFAETKHFTNIVKRLVKEFSPLDVSFASEFNTECHIDNVANALEDALKSNNDVIFILPSRPSAGKDDVIPQAVSKISDDIVARHFPQIGAHDLLIAEKRNKKIIALPYGYDKADVSVINRSVKQAIFSEKMSASDFNKRQSMFMSDGQVLDQSLSDSLISGKNLGSDTKKANIGIVILAAGIGSRTGRNKLMVEYEDGTPLFMRAVNAALGSEGRPVFIVTGYHDEEMAEFLEDIDINVLYNPAYRSGIKTSIALGLKSVPSFCEGALLLPADMPNITSADINKLIASYKKGKEKQVCMFMHHAQKANPIIWSSALYDKADIVPEDSLLRPIFMEHADYTTYVEVKNDAKFLDVNFPSDIEKALK